MTALFDEYLTSYKNKVKFVKYTKYIFFYTTIVWASFLIIATILLPIIYFVINKGAKNNAVDIAGIVASIITFAGIVFGVVKIVAQYLFSPDDEKNITEIVQSIQRNDLENKKVNLQYNSKEEKTIIKNKKKSKNT